MKLIICYKRMYSVVFFLICVSLFWINELPRTEILYSFHLDYKYMIINFVYIICAIYIIIKKVFNKEMNKIGNFVVLTLLGQFILNSIFLKQSLMNTLLLVVTYIVPIALIYTKERILTAKNQISIFLSVFNKLIIVLFLLGVLDYLMKGGIQLFIANNLLDEEGRILILEEHLSGIYRYYSFWGHPLHNAKLFLIFFIINNVYNRYFCNNNLPKYIFIITIIGLILSGSKTALVLGIFLMLFCNDIKSNKILFYLAFISIALIIFNTEMFKQNIMARFIYSIEYKNFSSGRNQLIEALLSGDYIRPSWWIGGGTNFSRLVSKNVGCGALNFEYPLIMLAYDYGIFTTILIYILIFFIPIYKFIRDKNYYILINYSALFLYVNTNNGLANISDSMAQFCFVTFLLINMSDYLKVRTIKNKVYYKL